MDLNKVDEQYQPEQGSVLHMEDWSGIPEFDNSGEKVTITLLGTDSETFRKATLQKAKNLQRKQGKKSDVDLELLEKEGISLNAQLIVSWTGIWEDEAKKIPLECNRKNAIMLLSHPKLRHYKEQIDRFITNRENFMTNSAEG